MWYRVWVGGVNIFLNLVRWPVPRRYQDQTTREEPNISEITKETSMEVTRVESVACIIPCYNCASTLLRAVESVQGQSVSVSEIILVDDGSTDETAMVIESLVLQDNRISRVAMSKNSGPSAARNCGWNMSTSTFVAFLDADDTWHRQKIELQLRLFELVPDLVIAGHIAAVEGELDGDVRYDFTDGDLLQRALVVSPRSILVRTPWSTPTIMLRRDLPFRFDEDQRQAEDLLLWGLILRSGHHALKLDLPLALLYKARFGAGGLSGNLWRMERGELATYYKLWRASKLNVAEYLFSSVVSLLKYVRRVVLVKWRT